VTAQLAANGVENYDKLAEAAGNLNAVAGGNKETFSSVGMVLTQTAGQGKLTTENFNQLSDAIPGASGKIQEALLNAGAYTGNFREALEKGEVTAQEFNDAVLQLGSDEAAQAAARSTKTIEGAAGNLQATIVGGFKDLIDYIKPGVTDLMGSITDSISSSIDWIKSTAAPSLRSVWSILTEGDFTGPIFGLEEDDALVDYLFRLRDAGAAVWGEAGGQRHQAAHPKERIPSGFLCDDVFPDESAADQHDADTDESDHCSVKTGERGGRPEEERQNEGAENDFFVPGHRSHGGQFFTRQLRRFRRLFQLRRADLVDKRRADEESEKPRHDTG